MEEDPGARQCLAHVRCTGLLAPQTRERLQALQSRGGIALVQSDPCLDGGHRRPVLAGRAVRLEVPDVLLRGSEIAVLHRQHGLGHTVERASIAVEQRRVPVAGSDQGDVVPGLGEVSVQGVHAGEEADAVEGVAAPVRGGEGGGLLPEVDGLLLLPAVVEGDTQVRAQQRHVAGVLLPLRFRGLVEQGQRSGCHLCGALRSSDGAQRRTLGRPDEDPLRGRERGPSGVRGRHRDAQQLESALAPQAAGLQAHPEQHGHQRLLLQPCHRYVAEQFDDTVPISVQQSVPPRHRDVGRQTQVVALHGEPQSFEGQVTAHGTLRGDTPQPGDLVREDCAELAAQHPARQGRELERAAAVGSPAAETEHLSLVQRPHDVRIAGERRGERNVDGIGDADPEHASKRLRVEAALGEPVLQVVLDHRGGGSQGRGIHAGPPQRQGADERGESSCRLSCRSRRVLVDVERATDLLIIEHEVFGSDERRVDQEVEALAVEGARPIRGDDQTGAGSGTDGATQRERAIALDGGSIVEHHDQVALSLVQARGHGGPALVAVVPPVGSGQDAQQRSGECLTPRDRRRHGQPYDVGGCGGRPVHQGRGLAGAGRRADECEGRLGLERGAQSRTPDGVRRYSRYMSVPLRDKCRHPVPPQVPPSTICRNPGRTSDARRDSDERRDERCRARGACP
ncbi:hypothetical protein CVS54_00182 [Microbacterium oxydans]|uniref:Uncharacterized protein n=1 Tax=Microbacterium oxydans TaxID=82380 RepID=A0A3Q9J414_9MICO|nr:hypothetical protein CVS54_00182 [Microbacterium oxydans]